MADDRTELSSDVETSDAETIESATILGFETDGSHSNVAYRSAVPTGPHLGLAQAWTFNDEPQIGPALESLTTPAIARKLDNIVDSNTQLLQSRIDRLTEDSLSRVGSNDTSSLGFLRQMYQLQVDVLRHYQRIDMILREAMDGKTSPAPADLAALCVGRAELLKAQAIASRESTAIKLEFRRLVDRMWRLPSIAMLGQAYRIALDGFLRGSHENSLDSDLDHVDEVAWEYSGSEMSEDLEEVGPEVQILSSDEACFNDRLVKYYSTPGSSMLNTPWLWTAKNMWCLVSGRVNPKEAHAVPVQIVPAAIGEDTAAYSFGDDIKDAYNTVWSVRNGIFLRDDLARLFQRGDFVIVPHPKAKNDFVVVALCPTLREASRNWPSAHGTGVKPLHRRRLQFQSAARPAARYLQMHAVISIARRRRAGPPGWLDDVQEVFDGQEWSNSHPSWARESMIHKLVQELGDGEGEEGVVQGLGHFPKDQRSASEERKMATLADADLAEYYEARKLEWPEKPSEVFSPRSLEQSVSLTVW